MTSFSKIKVLTPHLFWGSAPIWQSWQSWHVERVPFPMNPYRFPLGWKVVILVILCRSRLRVTRGRERSHGATVNGTGTFESMIFLFPQVLWFLMLPKTNSLQGTKVSHHWKRNIIFSLLMGYASSEEGIAPEKWIVGRPSAASSSGSKALCYANFHGGNMLLFVLGRVSIPSITFCGQIILEPFCTNLPVSKHTHRDSQPTWFFDGRRPFPVSHLPRTESSCHGVSADLSITRIDRWEQVGKMMYKSTAFKTLGWHSICIDGFLLGYL